jgi:hypothetical protein
MTINARFLPKYPKRIQVSGGLTKTEANGVVTFGINRDALELSTVATTGLYSDLLGKPTLGTAAATDVGNYATAAQGTKADSAVQPGSLGSLAYKNKADIADINASGIASSGTFLRGDGTWNTPSGAGDMTKAVYDTNVISLDVFAKGIPLRLKTDIASVTIPAPVEYIRTSGYSAVGVGAAMYKRVASQPSHPGKAQSLDGAWWEIAEQVIDQLMLGAVNDGNGNGGGTNNATALQATISVASALKRPALFVPGIYRCDSGLTVPARVEISAYGATIDFKSAGHIAGFSFINGGAILGATITGAGNAALNYNGVAIQCYGTNNSPSAPTYVSCPVIRDCIINGWAGYGILFNYTNVGMVSGCSVTNIGYAAIIGLSANDLLVHGNLIDGVTPGTADAYGVAFTRQSGSTETSDPRSYRCKAISNTIRNVVSVSGDNAQGLNTHGGVDLEFINNTIENCEVGITVGGANISGVPTLGPQRCIVSGNVFSSTSYVGAAIIVSGAIDGSSVNGWAESCIVTGNTIIRFGIASNGLSGAVIIQGTKGVVVTGNTIRSPCCNGIRIGLANVAFNVAGNIVIDPHDSSYTVPSCIYVSDDTNRGYIGENTFYFENGSLNTYVAVMSIRVEAGRSGLDIEIGRCSFVGIDGAHLSYYEGTLTGVNAAGLMVQRGRATLSLPATGNGTLAIPLKLFPGTPRITLQRISTPVPGSVAKPPILEADSISASGFTIIARPYDLTNFGGTGSLPVDWIATM